MRVQAETNWGVAHLSWYDVRYVNLRPTMPLSEYLFSMRMMLHRDHRPWHRRIARTPDVPLVGHFFRFQYQDDPNTKLGIHWLGSFVSVRQRTVTFPLWAAVLAFGLPPLLVLLRRERRRWRAAKAFCVSCGYDLRATPGRCPECGRVVDGAPVA